MAEGKVIEVIKFLEERLKKEGLKVSKIVLFGSRATGKTTKDSDIDIVIVSEDFRGKDIFKRVGLLKDAEVATIRKFMIPLDIVTMTPEEMESETSIIAAYAKEGETVYAA